MVGLGNEAVDGGLEIDDGSEDNKRLGIERPVAEYAHIPHSQLGSERRYRSALGLLAPIPRARGALGDQTDPLEPAGRRFGNFV